MTSNERDSGSSFVRSNADGSLRRDDFAGSLGFLRELGQESRVELVLFVLLALIVTVIEALRWCLSRMRDLWTDQR